MKTIVARAILVVSLVLCGGLGANCGSENGSQLKVLTLCELVENWKDYNQQTVRVRAIYAVGPVTDWLYDPACAKRHGPTGVEFRDDVKGPYEKLDRLVSRNSRKRRAWVIFEGVFHGPEPYTESEIDRTPPQLRDLFRKGHRRYGHMDAFDSMIEVTRVVEANEVAEDVPHFKLDANRKIFPDLP
jgi:hypothetical protein